MSSDFVARNLSFRAQTGELTDSARADPIASAFIWGLSAVFPEGERFFVQSVRKFAHLAEGTQAAHVEAFIRQEAYHSREHALFNREYEKAGIPLDQLLARTFNQLKYARARSPFNQLSATAGLEHLTAILAKQILAQPAHIAFASAETQALFRWHAVEEIEHKAVAYDLFVTATREWSAFRRWRSRSRHLLEGAARLSWIVYSNMRDILALQPDEQARKPSRILAYLLFRPGICLAMAPDYLRYFLPGFHPSKIKDLHLLDEARNDLEIDAQKNDRARGAGTLANALSATSAQPAT